jgi:hypothetical protein
LHRGFLIVAAVLIAAVAMAQDKPLLPVTPASDIGLEGGIDGPEALWPGPDGYGYSGQTATYEWLEISTTGTAIVGLTDDNFIGPLPIGFTFTFYGVGYTNFYASSNGHISFGAGSTALTNQCPLPNSGTPDNVVALLWDDLNFNTSGSAYYQYFATCPVGAGQCTVVEYSGVAHYGGAAGSAGTWEVILFDNGNVRVQYLDPGVEFGSGSTEGIEGANFAAGYGLTYVCDTAASLTAGLAIDYLFPSGIFLTPATAAKQGCEGSDVTYTLTLTNYTGADATFDLSYSSIWPISGPATLFVANMASANFDVVVSIPCDETSDVATVTASGADFSDSSTLTTSVTAGGFTAWESIDAISSLGRSRPAAAAVDGKVYLFGGEITGGREDTVEMFDPAVGVWVDMLGLMPVPASNVCAAAIGTDVYIPGGYSATPTYLNDLQVYHTTSDTWETIATDPLPVALSGAGCAAVGGKLYVFGGVNSSAAYVNTAYVYDPAAPAGTRWTALPNMTNTRGYLAGVAVGGKVYAVGGRTATVNLAYVEAFDPADGLWHTVTDMTTARGGPGAMFWGDLLVACGGGWSTYLTSCESYDTTQGYAGTWATLPQTMIQGRRTYAYASLPEALYAVAGYNGTYLTTAERLPAFDCPPCIEANIDVSPLSMAATQPPDTVTQQTLTITNTGGMDLSFTINEQPALKRAMTKPAPTGNPKSLTGSFVAFDPSAGGDTCYTPGTAGTFCFMAYSNSPDWEYAYNVWERFPADWTVSNVYVQGTPTCTGGGSWGTFSWSFLTAPFEVNIDHDRLHGSGGSTCTAYYCFDATPGGGGSADVSWYWDGDGYAGTPHWPCSNDGYTPAGQNACDEMINPVATVPSCGGADIPWLSESPTSGTVAAGGSVDITVTFDSTGLAPGGYSGDLEITSNDPDPGPGNGTNLVTVPVALTVTSVGDPDIDVTPASMFASQLTNTITQQTLNIGNAGVADLAWDIFEEGVELGVVQVTLAAGDAQAPEGTAVASGPYSARLETSYAVHRGVPLFVPPDVMLLAADDDNDYGSPIQALLQAYGDLGAVDLFDPRTTTPTLGQLQAYDVVVVWSNYLFADATAIGNVLADYVDAGGEVIDLMFALDPGWGYQGRFRSEGYSAMTLAGTSYVTSCLGTYNPGHPIMTGVTDVCDLYRGYGTVLNAGASEVARWQDNELFVAVKDNGTVATLNAYVGYNYLWTGQMPDVLHNAILWIAGAQTTCTSLSDVPWLSEVPTNGVTAPGGSTPVDVFFDSTGIAVGTYDANLCVFSNDPDEPIVEVPVTMEVVIPVELMGISIE